MDHGTVSCGGKVGSLLSDRRFLAHQKAFSSGEELFSSATLGSIRIRFNRKWIPHFPGILGPETGGIRAAFVPLMRVAS